MKIRWCRNPRKCLDTLVPKLLRALCATCTLCIEVHLKRLKLGPLGIVIKWWLHCRLHLLLLQYQHKAVKNAPGLDQVLFQTVCKLNARTKKRSQLFNSQRSYTHDMHASVHCTQFFETMQLARQAAALYSNSCVKGCNACRCVDPLLLHRDTRALSSCVQSSAVTQVWGLAAVHVLRDVREVNGILRRGYRHTSLHPKDTDIYVPEVVHIRILKAFDR